MTISRPAPRRWPVVIAAAVGGLVIGLLLGLALGGGDETDPEQAAGDTRSKLTQAAGLLEVAPVEYGQGVRNGEVVREAEYRGAQDAVKRSADLYGEARPVVETLAGTRDLAITQAYVRLERAMAARAAAADVTSQARRLRELLTD